MGVEVGNVESQIYIILIADACDEIDYLVIHDDSSTKQKGLGMRLNFTRGFDSVIYRGNSTNGIKSLFFGVE